MLLPEAPPHEQGIVSRVRGCRHLRVDYSGIIMRPSQGRSQHRFLCGHHACALRGTSPPRPHNRRTSTLPAVILSPYRCPTFSTCRHEHTQTPPPRRKLRKPTCQLGPQLRSPGPPRCHTCDTRSDPSCRIRNGPAHPDPHLARPPKSTPSKSSYYVAKMRCAMASQLWTTAYSFRIVPPRPPCMLIGTSMRAQGSSARGPLPSHSHNCPSTSRQQG